MNLLNTIKKLMLAVLFLAGTTAVQAHRVTDANIFGHIKDITTQEHIPHATIRVVGQTMGAVADATGHFVINNLPIGTITLVVSFVGYESQEMEVTTIAGRTIEVIFYLTPSVEALNQVVVSANRRATNRREAVSVVNLITPLTFEKTNSSFLADGLNFQPGLRVETNCSGCGFTQLRINGLPGPYTQILINSRAINSALASIYTLEHIPANMIERVEVVRGGASALFGSNAIGGVVNVIMRETMRNSLSASHTMSLIDGNTPENITNLNASIVSDNNRAGVTLFGALGQRSPVMSPMGDEFSILPKINMQNMGFRGFYRPTYNTRLSVYYHSANEFRRGGNKFDYPAHHSDFVEQVVHNIHSGGLTYDIFLNDGRSSLQVFSSIQSVNREKYAHKGHHHDHDHGHGHHFAPLSGGHDDCSGYGFTEDFSLIAGTQYTLQMNRLWFMPATFVGGVEFSHNSLNDRMIGHDRVINQTVNVGSLFAQNEWSNPRASFLIGARLDKHNMIDNPIFSPRLAVRYRPLSWLNLRTGYASGYRGPQAFVEDLHIAVIGGDLALIRLDPDLVPERSHSFTLSAETTHLFSEGRGIQFLAEGFYTRLNNVFVIEKYERSDGHLDLIRTNGDGAIVAGVNLEANWIAARNFQINSGFTIQTAHYTEPEQWSYNLPAQRRMFRAPNTYGFITALYSPMPRLDLSLSGIYTGSMLVQHFGAEECGGYFRPDRNFETPVFFDLGLRAAYTFDLRDNISLQLNAGVRNVFNSFQRNFDIGELRDPDFIFGPTLPRTFFVGMRLMI